MDGKGPGLKPPRIGLLRREVIGPPDCPILHRWTLFEKRIGKVVVHHFLPNADDRDVHDHPAGFVTIILRGGYLDVQREGTAEHMRAPMVRYRRAEHAHRTRVGPNGCWTIVVMGPKVRPWGFWKGGHWWPWKRYEEVFGFGMRCPEREGD